MNIQRPPENTLGLVYKPAVEALLTLGLPMLVNWEQILQPPLSAAVDRMIASEDPPLDIADALVDVGHFCIRLGEEIVQARLDRGLPMPEGPEDD